MTTTLTYFDFEGSRGLECRLALAAAGVPFTDERLSREQWAARRPTAPFGALPLLTVDGRVLAQSVAILTYIGRTHDLHPEDPWSAAQQEALMHSAEDLRYKLPSGAGLTEEAKQAAREAFATGWLRQWAQTVEAAIVGPFLSGDRLHVADLKLFVIAGAFLKGTYDHIPASVFDAYPKLLALHRAVEAHPAIRAYFAARG